MVTDIKIELPKDYGVDPYLPRYTEASELVEVEANVVGKMQLLESATAQAWQDMKAAAAKDDIVLLIVSGFRSVDYQASIFQKKLAAGQTIPEILKVNVAPGYSQHHTGQAIDIATPGSRPLTEEFAETEAFAWLNQHAAEFGFSMPYTRDNPFEIAYEPWHWSRLKT